MKDLIKITEQPIGTEEVKTVNARELHSFLDSRQDFSTWIKGRVNQYGFAQDIDFIQFHNFVESNSRPRIEFTITIEMAKELAMVERSDKGKQARTYFIECERKLKQVQPTKEMSKLD